MLKNLDTIPGIGPRVAEIIIVEIGNLIRPEADALGLTVRADPPMSRTA